MRFGGGGRCCRRALVTRCKNSKRVNLLHKVGDTGPASPSNANYKDPDHDEDVDQVHPDPAGQEERRLLHCVLQKQKTDTERDYFNRSEINAAPFFHHRYGWNSLNLKRQLHETGEILRLRRFQSNEA